MTYPLNWTRSSFCADNSCVEVVRDGDLVMLRDGKDLSRPPISFSLPEWGLFLDGIVEERRALP
jgi:hypothetical protein